MVAGGKYTTYRVMAKDAVDAAVRELGPQQVPGVLHRGRPAARRRGLPRAVERPARPGRAGPGCAIGPGRAPAQPLRVAAAGAARPDRRATRAGPRRWTARRSTSRSRRSTPRRTRARCTWTTSWPGGPGSPSRPGTAGSRPRSEVADLVAPVLGWDDGRRSTREVEHYANGWRPSGSRSTSPTTSPPTPPGSAPRTCGSGDPLERPRHRRRRSRSTSRVGRSRTLAGTKYGSDRLARGWVDRTHP